VAEQRNLAELLRETVQADPELQSQLDSAKLAALFDPVAATGAAQQLARRQLQSLRHTMAELDASHPFYK
jgi:3-carboxy-cis,cis-muconate cycloisomerase